VALRPCLNLRQRRLKPVSEDAGGHVQLVMRQSSMQDPRYLNHRECTSSIPSSEDHNAEAQNIESAVAEASQAVLRDIR